MISFITSPRGRKGSLAHIDAHPDPRVEEWATRISRTFCSRKGFFRGAYPDKAAAICPRCAAIAVKRNLQIPGIVQAASGIVRFA